MQIGFLSNLVITKIHAAFTLHNLRGTKGRRNGRECWAIVLKYEGETFYRANRKQILSDIQHIAVLPKGSSYEWECTQSGHYSFIEFECDLSYPEPFSIPIKHGEQLLKHFKELEYKRDMRAPMYEMESIRDTYSILLSLIKSAKDRYVPNSKRQKIQRAIEYISRHFTEHLTNDQLAALTGMSTVYFRKLFFEVMGVSPISYAKQLRLEKAKEMLKSDFGTLTDLALSLGYPSLYDFSRDFKRHTGTAPSKY